jgi:hypothetical protein
MQAFPLNYVHNDLLKKPTNILWGHDALSGTRIVDGDMCKRIDLWECI